MFKSESIANLADALSKAQGAMRNAVKDSDNPFFKSKYADLASVADACRDELAQNNLAVCQLPTMREGKMVLEYVLMHASGEFIGSELEMTPVKTDPQGIGSAITYARRYTLAGIANVATEDDDGNAASGNANGKEKRVPFTEKPVTFKRESAPKHSPVAEHVEGEAIVQEGKPNNNGADTRTAGLGNVPRANGGDVAQADKVRSVPAAAVKDSTAEAPRVVESEPSGPAQSVVEYISAGQQANFHKECRKVVPERLKMRADDLTYQWLMDNGYVNKGEPSAAAIPLSNWPNARNMAVKWLAAQ